MFNISSARQAEIVRTSCCTCCFTLSLYLVCQLFGYETNLAVWRRVWTGPRASQHGTETCVRSSAPLPSHRKGMHMLSQVNKGYWTTRATCSIDKQMYCYFYCSVWGIQARRGGDAQRPGTASLTWCLLHQANYWKRLWNHRINSCSGKQPETLGVWWVFSKQKIRGGTN